jgi:uncharacterized protein YbjT (DUF2867 family)
MSTSEIPRAEWNNFFAAFSGQHEGWLATLEIFAADAGAQEAAHELPFEGISVASGDDKAEAVAIHLGGPPEDHITHTIAGPEHVWLEELRGAADAAIEIESERQTKTLLRFQLGVEN